MKTTAIKAVLTLLVVSGFYSGAEALNPPANTIPIISMKAGQGTTSADITLEVLCQLLWHNFDGIWVEGFLGLHQGTPAELCDSVDAVMILAPSQLQELNNSSSKRWARYTPSRIDVATAFMHSEDWASIDSSISATTMLSNIETRCSNLYSQANTFDCIWYYDIFNEGSAWQLYRMQDSDYAYDDYFPSLFTQDTDMDEILPAGVFSWAKWRSDTLYSEGGPTVSCCFSMLHTIGDSVWAGLYDGIFLGSDTIQANSVRAYFSTKYLHYPSGFPYQEYDNFPEQLDLNTYPVRMAGYTWQDDQDSITVLGSATDLWMLEHYENLMDSTFIPAGTMDDGPFPIHYHPQAFGRTVGTAIWFINEEEPPDTIIRYVPYSYRIPSPGEFRMLCNIGLLRGAKGVFPYSLRSYNGWDEGELIHHDTSLLDENLIRFDAPYEDWVYRDRPTGDYYYAPPDSIPPWTAADSSHSQFDPLYSVPSRPSTSTSDPKYMEDYLEWKFAPYGRLWNSVSWTFRQIAWVAPELARLWWWYSDDRYDNASIVYDSGTLPPYFADPHIRVFTDSTETDCYLFYVNRFCRAIDNPFEITIDSGDFFPTSIDISEYALDHSRRFLIEGSQSGTEYTFLDTLDAGEARLLQMFDDTEGLDPDIRITDPDVFAVRATDGDTLTDFTGYDGAGVNIRATFYNMGTDTLNNVRVYLENLTTDEMLDTVTVSFNALTTDTCWQVSRAVAEFDTWTPDSTEIGVNVFSVYTEEITGEPDPTDNSATLVYLVKPLDYATEVLDDPWDMSEPAPPISPPAWKTFDIDSLTGSWGSYTDSISGMFEGVLSNPGSENALYLNIGSGRDDWIDADKYHNFSIAGRSSSPLNIEVNWMNSDSSSYSVDISEDLEPTAADIGPVDLSSLSSGDWADDVILMWLELTPVTHSSPANVRIGWVKLTE